MLGMTTVSKRQKSVTELPVSRVEVSNSALSKVPGNEKFY